jgi:hypothetical protein
MGIRKDVPAKKHLDQGAVSETVGAIILISIAVLAMGIVMVFLFSGPLPTNVPSFTGLISSSGNRVYISHEGGDTLTVGQFKILVDNSDKTDLFVQSLSSPRFSVGTKMNATLAGPPGRVVMVFNTSWGGGTVLLSANLVTVVPYGWYQAGWNYRKKITIDHTKVTSDLSDFPVLIYDSADVDLPGTVQADLDDILFTASDGMTKLSHEIDHYTSNDGTLYAWVKIPALSSATDTAIYMYFNNSGASNQQEVTAVWSNGYAGVWHLDNAFTDSASTHNNGINYGTTDAPGSIARGRAFSGVNQYITTPSTELYSANDYTISTWFKAGATDFAHHLIWEGNVTGNGWGESIPEKESETHISLGRYWGSGISDRLSFFLGNTDSDTGTLDVSSAFTDTTSWHHVSAVATGLSSSPSATLYLDGSPAGSDTGTTARIERSNWTSLQFGKPGDNERYFNGWLDEVRISTQTRSAGWIATEYNNQKNPGVGGFLKSFSTKQTPDTMS